MNIVTRRKGKPTEPDLLQGLMSPAPLMPDEPPTRPRTIKTGTFGVLDIGSNKICCMIGRVDSDGELRVLGMGHRAARGIRSGGITDLDEAFSAIQAVMAEAEVNCNLRIDSVTVNLSCGQPESQLFPVTLEIGGRAVTEQDVRRVAQEGLRQRSRAGRECIHILPVSFGVDDLQGVADPRAMRCDQLTARLHLIDAAASSVSNLMATLDRCSLGLKELVSAPMAAGLATLVEDERQLGATVIDMGAGTTGIAMFGEGQLLHTATLPVGGQHVTNDIARMLSTPVREAERLKTFYGSTEPSPDDETEMLNISLVGEEEYNVHPVPRSEVIKVIKPRLEETFEMVREQLGRSRVGAEAGNRVVLTGGASQLPGAREMAARILDRQVRLGRPLALRGLPESAQRPGFATTVGLLIWASGGGRHFADINLEDDRKPTWFTRVIKFLADRV